MYDCISSHTFIKQHRKDHISQQGFNLYNILSRLHYQVLFLAAAFLAFLTLGIAFSLVRFSRCVALDLSSTLGIDVGIASFPAAASPAEPQFSESYVLELS